MTEQEPTRAPMPRQDLSAFGGGRAVRSTRLAPRSRPTTAPAAEAAPAPAVEKPAEAFVAPPAPPSAAPARPSPRRAASAPAAAPPRKSGQQVIVYLSSEVATRLRAAGASTGRTYLQLMTEALDAVHPQLQNLLEAAGHIQRQPESSLFGQQVATVGRRAAGTSKAQISVRPPAHVLTVIDGLVAEHAAPNRSVLIEVALDAHLDKLPA